jgi:hypothetical protein
MDGADLLRQSPGTTLLGFRYLNSTTSFILTQMKRRLIQDAVSKLRRWAWPKPTQQRRGRLGCCDKTAVLSTC